MLIQGDCLEYMKTMEDNSVDLLFTDPPYALGSEIVIKENGKPDYKKAVDFMNKWDMPTGEFWEEWFKEAKRILKHGGHCLVFGMDRQNFMFKYYAHLAGFTSKQSLYWYFISNFPKSSSLSKNLNKRIDIQDILYQNVGTCLTLNSAKTAKNLYQKNQIETGTCTQKKELAQEHVSINLELKKAQVQDINLIVQIVGWRLSDTRSVVEAELNIAVENAKQSTTQRPSNATTVENQLQGQTQGAKVKNYTVQKSVQIKLSEKIMDKIKAEEAQKIVNGKDRYWRMGDINALCVEILKDLKHTILNHALNTLDYGTWQVTDFASATIVTTTKSIMDDLITSMADMLESMLKEKLISKKYNGYKYSIAPLKQTVEEIMVFQKPYKHKSCLNDVLAYEEGDESITVGALDIDGNKCKVEGAGEGRHPAQTFIDTGAGEAIDRQSGVKKGTKVVYNYTNQKEYHADGFIASIRPQSPSNRNDSGGASRILHKCDYETTDFDLFNYCPKVQRAERNKGLEGFEEKRASGYGYDKGLGKAGEGMFKDRNPIKLNVHPTVKPIKLLTNILKLFKTPNKQVILDPFMGSGSMGISAIQTGYEYIGIELSEDYFKIAEARIADAESSLL